MTDAAKLEVLRSMVPVLLKRAVAMQSPLASLEADCVLWAVGEIERLRSSARAATEDGRRDTPNTSGDAA